MINKDQLRITIAAYGVPGIIAIEKLFSIGINSNHINIITHENDERNNCLWNYANGNQIEISDSSPQSFECLSFVKNHHPDILFSLHYRLLIPKQILDIPTLGCVNLHPSLLPKYRGCFSIPWAIINGETHTGFSYHFMETDYDTGNIIFQKKVKILKTDTAFSLFHKLIILGQNPFTLVLNKILNNKNPGKPQFGDSNYYSRMVPNNGVIDLNWEEDKIERFIRALYFPPFKGAIVLYNNQIIEMKTFQDFKNFSKKYNQ